MSSDVFLNELDNISFNDLLYHIFLFILKRFYRFNCSFLLETKKIILTRTYYYCYFISINFSSVPTHVKHNANIYFSLGLDKVITEAEIIDKY